MSFSASSVEKAGTIKLWGGSTAPDGWLLCDSSAVSRTLYAELFASIGTTYGAGDGTTTFNLPDGNNAQLLSNTSVVIAGNGKTLGLTNGTDNFGLNNGSAGGAFCYAANFDTNIGTARSGTALTANKSYGLTTNGTKSGIVGTAAGTSNYRMIIKY